MDKIRYQQLSQEVDERLSEIVQEFNDSRAMLGNDKRVVRTRILLAFSFLEVICNIYNAYFNLGLANRQLLLKWIKEYCLDKKNSIYAKHLYLHMITDLHMYKFRNSIIHSFSLPEAENGISISTPNGLETSPIIQKMDVEFKKAGHSVAFISSDSLLQLFIEGYRMIHPDIFKGVAVANQSDLEGLERVAAEMERRGTRGIPLV